MVPKICSLEDCDRPHRGLGYCIAHYKRFRRWGDPNIKRPTTPASERFLAKVEKRGPEECWYWTAGVMSAGYGMFHPSKPESILAHRYAYELANGPESAEGMFIDHACHNDQDCPPGPCAHRLCCNPKHLEAVSNRENVNRSHNSNIRKTQCPRGHLYTPENTRHQIRMDTISRKCITCERERELFRPKRKAA